MAKLTAKQRAWVLELPKDFNATAAALRAGYSERTARQIGSENLSKPYLMAEVEKEFEKRAMSLDEAMARITEQGRSNIADFFGISPDGERVSLDPDMVRQQGHLIKKLKAQAVTKFNKKGDPYEYSTIEIELYDAQRALELMAKHRGALRERVEHEGEVTIVVKYVNPDADASKTS